MPNLECVFCHLPKKRILFENDSGIVFLDGFPISKGHTLVISKRHVHTLYDLPESEQRDLWQLVSRVRLHLKEKFNPDGFNIGLNEGQFAGQTLPHAHIHVIPRYQDDVPDPRGGIRWVIPEKARYW